jgi:crossover junction endodeoxyribonuclease RuvC
MIVGIDCGAHGAIALMTDNGFLVSVYDMPSIDLKVGKTVRRRVSAAGVADLIRKLGPTQAIVEQVGGMPGQSSMFAFGQAAGIVEGVLATLGVSTTFVTPMAWKRFVGLSTADKGLARQKALQLFPGAADRLSRVKDSDRAEAILIAWYGAMKVMRTAA